LNHEAVREELIPNHDGTNIKQTVSAVSNSKVGTALTLIVSSHLSVGGGMRFLLVREVVARRLRGLERWRLGVRGDRPGREGWGHKVQGQEGGR
jgi:hypothetical protein